MRVACERNGLRGGFSAVERVPDLLGQERHERAKQAQRGLKDAGERGERGGSDVVPNVGGGFGGGIAEVETKLYELEVPVTQLAPEELETALAASSKRYAARARSTSPQDSGKAGDDPAGFKGSGVRKFCLGGGRRSRRGDLSTVLRIGRDDMRLCRSKSGLCPAGVYDDVVAGGLSAVELQEEEARGVPDLVGKGAVALGACFGEGDIGAGRSHAGERKANPHLCRIWSRSRWGR